ncbi:glycine cleavage system aminomethyltransferase GcvT [Nocardioides maradonensis]
MSRLTALHAVHTELGASFTDFAGWQMPVRYGSEIAEHQAVRTTAGLFDLSHMGELEVTGPAAAAALDHALVGRPSAIGVGKARYQMICAPDGGIIDDLVVYRLDEEHFLVVVNASNVEPVVEALRERVAAYDATLRDASEEWALIAIQGPVSARVLQRLTDLDLTGLKYYTIATGKVAGEPVHLARTGYTGEDGFEIYCRPDVAAGLWTALSEAGAEDGLLPAGLACRDTLRLEAGMPLYGHELSRDITPFEAGLHRVIAFDKPAGFVGDTALAARRDEGARSALVGLVLEGRRSPRAGYAVLDPATGSPIGTVTSGAPSPTLGHAIAIAAVPVGIGPGDTVDVDLRGTATPARVVALPFYKRPA